MNLFHLSLPCNNVKITGDYYVKNLGAFKGRSKDNWVDINLYGNQITFTQSGAFRFDSKFYRFEEAVLPSFHFGVIMDYKPWEHLLEKLTIANLLAIPSMSFLRHENGEHQSFFIKDPNDYYVEFKTFADFSQVFQK